MTTNPESYIQFIQLEKYSSYQPGQSELVLSGYYATGVSIYFAAYHETANGSAEPNNIFVCLVLSVLCELGLV